MDEKAREAREALEAALPGGKDEKTHESFELELSRQKEAEPFAGSPVGREASPDAKLLVAAIEKAAVDIVEAISRRP